VNINIALIFWKEKSNHKATDYFWENWLLSVNARSKYPF
jgi:hypothetical protein